MYSLVSREVIADSIETACNAQSMDGVLAIGGGDKNMPGALIAIDRMNLPSPRWISLRKFKSLDDEEIKDWHFPLMVKSYKGG